jgi:hypothetical protein
MRTVLAE